MNGVLSSKSIKFQNKIIDAPLNPGCYLYRDSDGGILYVGKAKVIRNRVRSYFQNYERIDPKIQIMIDQAEDIDFVIADSEIEALILETNLIKKYKPKYNKMMVDDKSYIWLRVDRRKGAPIPEKLKNNPDLLPGVDYPTLTVVRKKKDDGAHYYGPYPDTRPVKRTIERVRRVFPFCTDGKKYERSNETAIIITSNHKKPCFHYHLGLCNGVCAGLETKAEYNKRMEDIKRFYSGQKNKIEQKLLLDMQDAAKNHRFEKAAILRDRLNDIKYVTKHIRIDQDLDEVEIMEKKRQSRESAVQDLIAYLNFPQLQNSDHFRIEAFDISNIQGTNAVGAMTVFINGKAEPKMYRKFRIRMKNEPNDFAMLQETLFRRFYCYLVNHELAKSMVLEDSEGIEIDVNKYFTDGAKKLDESMNTVPDVILIDGGKGQLSASFKIMKSFGLNIPMIGLAKKQEEVYVVEQQRIDPDFIEHYDISQQDLDIRKIHLPKATAASYILQQVRDEAHRFGISYHRKLRIKQAIEKDKPIRRRKRK